MTKRITIKQADILGPFITPPENQGQMVTVSYTCTENYILVQTSDASDRTEKLEAYHWPASANEGDFSPQNRTPKLGWRVGLAQITL